MPTRFHLAHVAYPRSGAQPALWPQAPGYTRMQTCHASEENFSFWVKLQRIREWWKHRGFAFSLRMDGERTKCCSSKWDTSSRASATQALPDHHDKTNMALGQGRAAHSSSTEYLVTVVCRSTEKERDGSTARRCQSTGRQLQNTGCSTMSAKFDYNLLRPSDVLHYFKISITGEK